MFKKNCESNFESIKAGKKKHLKCPFPVSRIQFQERGNFCVKLKIENEDRTKILVN